MRNYYRLINNCYYPKLIQDDYYYYYHNRTCPQHVLIPNYASNKCLGLPNSYSHDSNRTEFE